jgi:hypothetical protein
MKSVNLKDVNVVLQAYQKHTLKELKEELSAFNQIGTLEEYARLYEDAQTVDRVYVLLNYNGTLLFPYKKSYNSNMYGFTIEGKNYPYDLVNKFDVLNKKPNYVGKPSKKKMDEWVEYLNKKDEFITNCINEGNSTKDNYLKKLRDKYPVDSITFSNTEETEGRVKINNIILKFTISQNSVWERIELNYGLQHNQETFDKLVNALK